MKRRTESRARSVLRERLEARRPEIEEAVLARAISIGNLSEAAEPAYADGLLAAVAAALDHAMEAIGHSSQAGPPVPVSLLAQARLAARNNVGLDTVLRRYLAGYTLFSYFVIDEAGRSSPMGSPELKRLFATQSSLFDRLLEAVGAEHRRESEQRLSSAGRHQAKRVVRLMEGELVDTADIAYDFEGWHLGAVASGSGASDAIGALFDLRDCRLLTVEREGEVIWAWLGTHRTPDSLVLDRIRSSPLPVGMSLALGEPGRGLAGWRLTHRQAQSALNIARRSRRTIVRYADVALLASIVRDDVLVVSLREIYLAPLADGTDGGAVFHDTLRAYFAAGRHVSSTAAALGVTRRTVNNRLRAIEGRLGRSLDTCSAELQMALRVLDLSAYERRGAD